MNRTRQTTNLRRTNGLGPRARSLPPTLPVAPGASPAPRRFNPRERSPSEGGSVYGGLVAGQRVKLGLTQRELAARINVSRSTVSRIERGQQPSAEMRRRISLALNPAPPAGPLRRTSACVGRAATRVAAWVAGLATWVAGWLAGFAAREVRGAARMAGVAIGIVRFTVGVVGLALWLAGFAAWDAGGVVARARPGVPHVLRWVWAGMVPAVLIALLVLVNGGSSDTGQGVRSLQPALEVSDGPGAPAAIHSARVQFAREASAEVRKAGQVFPLPAAGGAPRTSADPNTPAASQPVSRPISPSPSPGGGSGGSGGRGGGGGAPGGGGSGGNGGPSGPAPQPSPGVGSQGGNAPQAPAPATSGGGSGSSGSSSSGGGGSSSSGGGSSGSSSGGGGSSSGGGGAVPHLPVCVLGLLC